MSAKLQARIVIAVGLELRAVRVNEHDLPAHPARKRPCLLVYGISQLLDRSLHTFPSRGTYVRTFVENARDGDARYTGCLGNIIDRRTSLSHARRLAIDSTVRNG